MAKDPKRRSKAIRPKTKKPARRPALKPGQSGRKQSKAKPPKKKKETKVILHSTDCKWWHDLSCTIPDQDSDWHLAHGWDIVSDSPAQNPKYPNVDRRVELERDAPRDDTPLGVHMF